MQEFQTQTSARSDRESLHSRTLPLDPPLREWLLVTSRWSSCSSYCSTDLPFLIRHFVAKWTSVTLPRFCLQSRPYHWPFNARDDSLFQGSHVPVCKIRFCFNQKLAVFFLDFQFGMTPYMALPVCDDVMFLSQWSIDRQVQLSPYSASS